MKQFHEYIKETQLEEASKRDKWTAKKVVSALEKKFDLLNVKTDKKANNRITSAMTEAIRGDVLDEIEKMGGVKSSRTVRPGWEEYYINDRLGILVNKKMNKHPDAEGPVTRLDVVEVLK